MAVPKKRRLTRKLLNRGTQFRRLYSSLWASSLFQLRTAGVGKVYLCKQLPPLKTTSAARNLAMMPTPLPARVPFDRPMPNLSYIVPTGKKRPLVTSLPPRMLFHPLTRDTRTPMSPTPFVNYPVTYPWNAYRYTKFNWKLKLLAMRTPHTWGPQRHYLLQEFCTKPSYLFLFPAPIKLAQLNSAFTGLVYPVWSSNLKRPFGPTLGDLWAYTKANPNEGYWIYCMWLNVRKRWRRWLVFPYTYAAKRNVFRRILMTKAFEFNTAAHRHISVYKRLGLLWQKLICKLPVCKAAPSETFLTTVARKLVTHQFLKKKV